MKGVLFSFEQEGWQSLRVPYSVYPTLREFWLAEKESCDIAVVDCTRHVSTISEGKETKVESSLFLNFIRDCNTLPDHDNQFSFVAIDSLAPFAGEALNFVIALNSRNLPQIQDYRDAYSKVKEVLFRLFSLRKKLILIAHWATEKDEITGKASQVPQAWGNNLPRDVIKWFSTTLQAQAVPDGKGGTTYQWITKPEGLIESLGSRIVDNLPRALPQNFTSFFQLAKIRPEDGHSILLIGAPLTGKTRSLGTL